MLSSKRLLQASPRAVPLEVVLTHIYHVSHHKPGHDKVLNRHAIAGVNESY